MARFTRIEVALKMKETGIVPVFYHKDAEICKSVLKACYDGGIRVFEFTNRGDFAHEVFGELNKWAAKELSLIHISEPTRLGMISYAVFCLKKKKKKKKNQQSLI